MTGIAVILARNSQEAEQAAFNLGLDAWMHPTKVESLRGHQVDLIVQVDGWRESEAQSVELVQMVYSRTTRDYLVLEQPRTEAFLRTPFQATAALEHQRRLRGGTVVTTGIDPDLRPVIMHGRERRGFWFWLRGVLR